MDRQKNEKSYFDFLLNLEGGGNIENEILDFYKVMFKQIIQTVLIGLIAIILYVCYLFFVLHQYEHKERLIRCVFAAIVCYIFKIKNFSSFKSFNLVIYAMFLIITILGNESCLKITPLSR